MFTDEEKEQIYKLACGPIHQAPRQKVVKSHLKHCEKFIIYHPDEFRRFIVNKYLEYRLLQKKFSVNYYTTVVESIMRYRNVTDFDSSSVQKIVNNLNKMFNPENNDNTFYTNTGERIELDIKNKRIGDLSVASGCTLALKTDANRHFRGNQFNKKIYSEEHFELIKNYYKNHMDNFLLSTKKVVDVHDELALLTLFIISTAKRSCEILNLTINKVHDLILRNQTDVKSKTGTGVDILIIPFQFATILQRYLDHIDPSDESQKLFNYNYRKLYFVYKKNLKVIIGDDVPADEYRSYAFHAFRHYFANKHFEKNSHITMQQMSHKSKKMTRSYATKQEAKLAVGNMKKFMKENYPL